MPHLFYSDWQPGAIPSLLGLTHKDHAFFTETDRHRGHASFTVNGNQRPHLLFWDWHTKTAVLIDTHKHRGHAFFVVPRTCLLHLDQHNQDHASFTGSHMHRCHASINVTWIQRPCLHSWNWNKGELTCSIANCIPQGLSKWIKYFRLQWRVLGTFSVKGSTKKCFPKKDLWTSPPLLIKLRK